MKTTRPIAELLWDLVGENDDRSGQAAEEITRIWERMVQEAAEARGEEPFKALVQGVVDASDFDARAFVVALYGKLLQVQTERCERIQTSSRRRSRIANRLLRQRREASTGERRDALNARLRRVTNPYPEPERTRQLSSRYISLICVLETLDRQLLLAPESLRTLLQDRGFHHHAVETLVRIGPPAAPYFADELMAQLASVAHRGPAGFTQPRALAALIRGDSVLVQQVADHLHDSAPEVVRAAAKTLYEMGEEAARLAPECVGRLLALTHDPAIRQAAVEALGHVTQGTDVAIERLLEVSRDSDVWVKGESITALGEIGRQPDKVVPRLIEAFEDYQEPDPDFCYYSEHERVVRALQEFGPEAAPALPVLLAHIRVGEGRDTGIIETLVTIGAPARGVALPVLEQLASEAGYDEITAEDDYDPLVAAILRLRDVS